MKNHEYRRIAEKARADFAALPSAAERKEYKERLWQDLKAARLRVQELEAEYKGVATA